MSYEVLADGSANIQAPVNRVAEIESLMIEIKAENGKYIVNNQSEHPTLKKCAKANLRKMIADISTVVFFSNSLQDGSKLKIELHEHMRALSEEINEPDDSIKILRDYEIVKNYFDRKKLGVFSTVFEGVDYLDPFKKPKDFDQYHRFHKALFWVMRTVECVLLPIRFLGWIVRNALRGFFFALRHPKFWEWNNVNDQDADLNPKQKFVKDLAKGFDNFFEANVEMLSRPLDIIEMFFKFVVMDKKWEKIKEMVKDKFENEPVASWTTVLLFTIQIALSIALPVALLPTSAGVAAGVGGATRHLMIPGTGCVAVAGVVAPAVVGGVTGVGVTAGISPSLSSVVNLFSSFDDNNPKSEIEYLRQSLTLLYKNATDFAEEQYPDLHAEICAAITNAEERLQQLNPAHHLEQREEHISDLKKTLMLLRENLTAELSQIDPPLFHEIHQAVIKYEKEIKTYEAQQLANAPVIVDDFVWIKSVKDSSAKNNRDWIFSVQNSNHVSSNNEPVSRNKVSSQSMKRM